MCFLAELITNKPAYKRNFYMVDDYTGIAKDADSGVLILSIGQRKAILHRPPGPFLLAKGVGLRKEVGHTYISHALFKLTHKRTHKTDCGEPINTIWLLRDAKHASSMVFIFSS